MDLNDKRLTEEEVQRMIADGQFARMAKEVFLFLLVISLVGTTVYFVWGWRKDYYQERDMVYEAMDRVYGLEQRVEKLEEGRKVR